MQDWKPGPLGGFEEMDGERRANLFSAGRQPLSLGIELQGKEMVLS